VLRLGRALEVRRPGREGREIFRTGASARSGEWGSLRFFEFFAHFLGNLKEAVVMVHAGVMAIAPIDLNGVTTDELHPGGANIRTDGFSLNDPSAGVLVYASRAGAQKPKFHIRNRIFIPIIETQEHLSWA
jgi:hypothetical protein